MSKYEPLGRYLAATRSREIPMTFSEVEKVLGFPLPPSARRHPAWWSNNVGTHVAVRSWREAGLKTSRVDLGSERVVFVRDGGTDPLPASEPAQPPSPAGNGEDVLTLRLAELSGGARRLLDDYAEASGGDRELAVRQLIEAAALERRKQLIHWFAERNQGVGSSSAELIREDRDVG